MSQVDSSVGGKTGVNSKLGKNLIGSFHQPLAVIADINILKSLPEREFRAGFAEVIKYGLIKNKKFFNWLELELENIFNYESFQLEGILTPKHEINRFPYGEKDYPLSIPEKPTIEYPVENDLEIGFRVQTTIGESDLGFSFINGNDRSPSVLSANVTVQDGIPPVINKFLFLI